MRPMLAGPVLEEDVQTTTAVCPLRADPGPVRGPRREWYPCPFNVAGSSRPTEHLYVAVPVPDLYESHRDLELDVVGHGAPTSTRSATRCWSKENLLWVSASGPTPGAPPLL